ncbi:MAG: LamG domain-containing protein [Chloroflexaceae bacterium]|nr:LamG domain-containing protein [Chloroflexaceae bacterium]
MALFAIALAFGFLAPPPAEATIPNRQPWSHVPGACPAAVEGAVFARSTDNCGGNGTAFDTNEIYGHVILQDVATSVAPCSGVATGGACFRQWYTGVDSGGLRRIGYATSPDGIAWTRVPGTAGSGSVLFRGPAGSFDSNEVSFPTVVRTSTGFEMWYVGSNGSVFSLGYATSTDGVNWTRVTGPLAGGSVLRPSGVEGTFDQDIVAAPRVIRDQATTAAPCEAGRTSGACYRLWYQGVDNAPTYAFLIGHAVSPDGLNWTRRPGAGAGGAVVGRGPAGTFDSNNAAVASVIKDGPLYRMWYDARDSSGIARIGHVVSTDGVNWVRPVPNDPVWRGNMDPGTLSPDDVWAPSVLKDGLTYRLWYNHSTRPNARRVGYAVVTPGAALSSVGVSNSANSYTVSFTTAQAIPANGYVLITLPPEIPFSEVTAGAITGFDGAATLVADSAAITDGRSGNIARGALVVRLPNGAAVGPKNVSFTLAAQPAANATLQVQTFDSREVLERGSSTITGSGATPTPTPVPPTATATSIPTATNTATAGPSATPTSSPTATNTSTATPTSTPTLPPTLTPTPGPGGDNQPWTPVAGTCAPGLNGAVFARAGDNCGGTGTSFDTYEIFPPQVLYDEASSVAPCENGRTSGPCYRMWYVGTNNPPSETRRIGYALSPDGVTWTRVVGTGTGGSVFEASGVAGDFDRNGVTTMNVIKEGTTFRMWYTGIGDNGAIAGIGLAESQNGTSWTRVRGPLANGAVLTHSGDPNQFDTHYIVAPSVMRDAASAAAPCENGRTSGTCYRIWFEGVRTSPAYVFAIGYAVSPNGLNWTRISNNADGAVFRASPYNTRFDDNSVGVPFVMKDGAFYRMWYESRGYTSGYTTGYVVSTDGVNWVRATPGAPVYDGSRDSIVVGSPDELWAIRAMKEGSRYRLWYATSTRPSSRRFALTEMTPGTTLGTVTVEQSGLNYTLRFTTAAIPANGSVLVTLPPTINFANVTAGAITGFGASATHTADAAALTDASARGVARGALLVRLPNGATAGEKTISFSLSSAPASATSLLVQVFNSREVLQYGTATLAQGPTPTPTNTSLPTNTPLPTNTATAGPSPTATLVPTNTPVPTATPVPTSTPVPTATSTPVPGSNSALNFAGGDDEARATQVAGLNGTQTIELWVRPSANNQTAVLVATGDSNGWALELDNGQATWWVLNTSGSWVSARNTNVSLQANTWYHVALTYTAGTAQVYVNGNQGAAANVGNITVGPNLRLGGLTGYGFFNGQLDEVRLSNVVRYTTAFTPPTAGFTPDANTLALWRLNEGSGQTSTDSSGNGYTLTLGTTAGAETADPTWVNSTAPTGGGGPAPTATSTPLPTTTPLPTNTATAGPSPTATPVPTSTPVPTATSTPVPGSNQALNFAGGDDEARANQVAGLNGTQTIELWVRPSANNQTAVLVATGDSSGWSLELDNGQVVWWVLTSANSWTPVRNTAITLQANTWYHVAVTYAAGNARVYVNGNQGPTTTLGALTVGSTLRLGGWAGFGFFNGQLDEVRLSNVERYSATFTPPSVGFTPDANTLALWRLNEGSGQTNADSSGNGYTLTLGTTAGADAADPTWVNSTAPTN